MKEHVKDNHNIEQPDGSSELCKSTGQIEHDEKNEASQFTCTLCGEAFVTKVKHHCHTVYCPKRIVENCSD